MIDVNDKSFLEIGSIMPNICVARIVIQFGTLAEK